MYKEEFEKNRYVWMKGFLDKENCHQLTTILKTEAEKMGWHDTQCPSSKSIRDHATFDKLLADLLPHMEEASGLKLIPTYAYARVYAPGEVLKIHRDRPACEISATITLGFDGDVWPIYIGKPSETPTEFSRVDAHGETVYAVNVTNAAMEVGDAILYRGCEMYHGRDEYKEGKWQAQVFLHYVDANGPHKDWAYDKRPGLAKKEDNDLTIWMYDDILTPKDCDALIRLYTEADSIEAAIGGANGVINKEIRNVNRVILPVHKGIGARLAAAGFDANAQRWKFDVRKANQSEFLRYPAGGGRYKGHLDTFISMDRVAQEECRKVTVLAFLNDDFKGGKFFLQTGHEKLYPPQKKGTVLCFPSFLLHGVEDVEEGERFSVVTWLVGPWFK